MEPEAHAAADADAGVSPAAKAAPALKKKKKKSSKKARAKRFAPITVFGVLLCYCLVHFLHGRRSKAPVCSTMARLGEHRMHVDAGGGCRLVTRAGEVTTRRGVTDAVGRVTQGGSRNFDSPCKKKRAFGEHKFPAIR